MSIWREAKAAGIPRRYLRLAAMYRRCSTLERGYCTWEALKEQFQWETHGTVRPDRMNGFACGQRFLSVTEASVIEDINRGYACKAEFYHGPSGWHWKVKLRDVRAAPLFAHRS